VCVCVCVCVRFDKCKSCVGILDNLGLKIWINLH